MEIGEVLGKWHYLRIIEHFSKSEPSKFSSLYFTTKTIGEKFKIPEVNKDNFSFGVADFIGVMINFFCWLDSLCGFRVISAALRSFRFGHRDLPVFLGIFPCSQWSIMKSKIGWEDLWAAVTKAGEGKSTKEPHWERKAPGEARTGGSQPSSYANQKNCGTSKSKFIEVLTICLLKLKKTSLHILW